MNQSINLKIKDFLVNQGASKIAVFGSYSGENFNSTSDIDILVNFHTAKGLLELSRIQRTLSQNIGYKIDLVTEKALSPHISKEIENSMVILYEE